MCIVYYTHKWVVKIEIYWNMKRCIFYLFFFLPCSSQNSTAHVHPHSRSHSLMRCWTYSVRDLSKKDCIRKTSRWTAYQGEHWAVNTFQGTRDKPHGYFLFERGYQVFEISNSNEKKGMDAFQKGGCEEGEWGRKQGREKKGRKKWRKREQKKKRKRKREKERKKREREKDERQRKRDRKEREKERQTDRKNRILIKKLKKMGLPQTAFWFCSQYFL